MKLKTIFLSSSLLIIILSFFIDSPFRKGGVTQQYLVSALVLVMTLCFIYLLQINAMIVAEKVLYTIVTSFIAIFVSNYLTETVLCYKYGIDYELFVNEILANLLFYSLINLFLAFQFILLRRYRSS